MTAMISRYAQLERSKSLALAVVCTRPQVSVVLDDIVDFLKLGRFSSVLY